MRRVVAFLFGLLMGGLSVGAQEAINLAGEWELSLGDSLHYNDYVILPARLAVDQRQG